MGKTFVYLRFMKINRFFASVCEWRVQYVITISANYQQQQQPQKKLSEKIRSIWTDWLSSVRMSEK